MAQRIRTDWILFGAIVAAVCFGLWMLYSASTVMADLRYNSSYHFTLRQLGWAALAIPVMMLLKQWDYRRLNNAAWAFIPMGLIMALLVHVYFADKRAHRWEHLGPLSFQPSELAKPALIVFLAYFVTLRSRDINGRHTLLPVSISAGVLSGLVMIADLGTAVVMVATVVTVFFVAGLGWRYLAVASAVIFVFLVIAIILQPYRVLRVVGHYDPEYKILDWLDPSGKMKAEMLKLSAGRDPRYHLRQSLIAVGSGGPEGQGPMQGKQKLLFLPEPHNDFIYAVVAEELGLWGAMGVLLIFLLILWRGLRLYLFALDDFGRYLALGVTTMVAVQAFMNISVVLGVVPTKGIPLPMISYGGSSLMGTLSCLGLLLSVGDHSG